MGIMVRGMNTYGHEVYFLKYILFNIEIDILSFYIYL